jgi:hypothetical protein
VIPLRDADLHRILTEVLPAGLTGEERRSYASVRGTFSGLGQEADITSRESTEDLASLRRIPYS